MVDVVVLDVNETLFGLGPVEEALRALGLPDGSLDLWFARVLRDGFAAAGAHAFVAFPDLARHHVRVLGQAAGLTIDDTGVDGVVAAFDLVTPHPDVDAGLRLLADAGLRLAPFTNGSAAIVDRFLARTGLDEVVEPARDVTAPGRWKPDPVAYRWVCRDLGVAPGDAALVAVHPWDVAGAAAVGMVGAWVDRDAATWPGWLPAPAVAGRDLPAVASALLAR